VGRQKRQRRGTSMPVGSTVAERYFSRFTEGDSQSGGAKVKKTKTIVQGDPETTNN